MQPLTDDTLKRLKGAVDANGWTQDPATLAPHLKEWRGRYQGRTPILLMPARVEDVAAIMRICAETQTPLVPQGGNTGLVGGQIPFGEVLLSLKRLSRIRAFDALNNTVTVEAGVVLADIQRAAESADRLYPLSLASEGSAMIGGLLSTNAGGVNVLRYGMAREHVLGLEVVLPDGQIFDGLRAMRKDNTGYDIKQLFIGAEGTLGIITAAVLKLWPRPRETATAFVSLRTVENAVRLFHALSASLGGALSAAELVPRIGIEFVLRHVPGARDPLPRPAPWYLLIEATSPATAGLAPVFEDALAQAAAAGLLDDAVIAQSEADRARLWTLRERLSEVQKFEGGSIKHDISVPLSHIAEFIRRASEAVEAACPGIRPVAFGHIGDGNVHFNLSEPMGAETPAFLARWDELSRLVHDIAAGLGGSISAEHGLGIMKREEILRYRSASEMDLMRRIKRALDPNGLLNPGKVL